MARGGGRMPLSRVLAGLGFCTRSTALAFVQQPFIRVSVKGVPLGSSASVLDNKTREEIHNMDQSLAEMRRMGEETERLERTQEVLAGRKMKTAVKRALSTVRCRRQDVQIDFIPFLAAPKVDPSVISAVDKTSKRNIQSDAESERKHFGMRNTNSLVIDSDESESADSEFNAEDGDESVDKTGYGEDDGGVEYEKPTLPTDFDEVVFEELSPEEQDAMAANAGLRVVRHPWHEFENSPAVKGMKFVGPSDLMAIILHKPAGYVCSHNERDGKTIFELLPPRLSFANPPFSIAGRLDKDASGLCVVTQEGQLTSRIIGGSTQHDRIEKVYDVRLRHPLRGDEAAIIASGELKLRNEVNPCRPAKMEVLSDGPHDPRELELESPLAASAWRGDLSDGSESGEDSVVEQHPDKADFWAEQSPGVDDANDESRRQSTGYDFDEADELDYDDDEEVDRRAPRPGSTGGPLVRVSLVEGKYHHIKRVFAALSNRVEHIHRVSVGPLTLGSELASGDWRSMTHAEFAAVMKRIPRSQQPKPQPQRATVTESTAMVGEVM